MRARCCRSEPRCRACPIMLNKELREIRELGLPGFGAELPAHLAGLPTCLHKYGPLFAEQLRRQQQVPDEASAA